MKLFHIDPFTKRHKLIHNGGFPKFEILYCSQYTVKSVKIQQSLSYEVVFQITKFLVNWTAVTVFGCIRHYGPVCLLLLHDDIENISVVTLTVYWVSKQKVKRFFHHRAKGFCLIIKFSFDFNKKT